MHDQRITTERMLDIFGDKLSPSQRATLQRQCRFLSRGEADELETMLLAVMDKHDELARRHQIQVGRKDLFLTITKGICVATIIGSVAGLIALLVNPEWHNKAFEYGASAGAAGFVLAQLKKDDLKKFLED